MSRKVFGSHWYSDEKYIFRWREDRWEHVVSPEGYLFAQGRYLTKIKESDLPPWFIRCYIHRQYGWLDTKRIFDLLYKPNMHVNHAFKDDFLYISYTPGQKIVHDPSSIAGYTGYDEVIWGHCITDVVRAAKQNAGFDTSKIEQQIIDKLAWFKEAYPDDYKYEVGDWIYEP